MKQFPLKVGQSTLQFDTDGLVKDATGAKVGTWTTDTGNRIVFSRDSGGSENLDIAWSFDSENRLTIKQGDKTAITFARTGSELPMFRLDDNNRLLVNPDGDLAGPGKFEFPLVCKFGLNADANLIVSINGVESVLQGFISDEASRFRFWFDDLVLNTGPSGLMFAGSWQRQEQGFENEIRLRFDLADPALQLPGKPFVMPAAATVDKKTNHLLVVYRSKQGVKEMRFSGRLEIGRDTSLVFIIENTKTPTLKKTSITVEATFGWARGEGTAVFYVGRVENKTDKTQVIEVRGDLTAKMGDDRKITLTFAYRKATGAGKPAEVKLATTVAIENKNSRFTLLYERDGKVQRFEVTAQMSTAKFDVSGGIAIINEQGKPEARQVTAFIGISW